MSAIFGIINKKGDAVDDVLAIRMQEALLHRAVDDKGRYKKDNAFFGHHKLTVHRRQTFEKQPLEMGDFVITSDARIDNIEELVHQLNVKDAGVTDSFIILKAFEKWGRNCVDHLEGEFCFAIWNKKDRTLYGANDHIGFKSFYYYENDHLFAFSSTIKALEVIKLEKFEINPQIFIDYYSNVFTPITYDKNIHLLQGGHTIFLDHDSKIKLKQHWILSENFHLVKNVTNWYEYTLNSITNNIKPILKTDFAIGILLSGGLDSSLLTAIACKLLKEENKVLHAFCSVLPEDYKGEDKDERFYIEKLKGYFDNLEIHYVVVPENKGPYHNLEKVFEDVEAPVNIFHYVDAALFEKAKELNVRFLLSGYGGDSTISNKGRGIPFYYLKQGKMSTTFKLLRKLYYNSSNSFFAVVKSEIFNQLFIYKKIKALFRKDLYFEFAPFTKQCIKQINKNENQSNNYRRDFINSVNNGMISSDILEFKKHAKIYNIEYIAPLLSKEVIQLFVNVPPHYFIVDGIRRSFIRNALYGLVPNDITNRKDKIPYSPDCDNRIIKINENITKRLKYKDLSKTTFTGIDYDKLIELILEIDNNEIKTTITLNNKIVFIPFAIIADEFYKWLKRKL